MCYSATASFTAAAVLTAIGCVLLFRVKSRTLWPLALIPLFFAIQQASEGYLWLSSGSSVWAKNAYLFFAFVLWPLWIPFSFWLPELVKWRKVAIAIIFFVGIIVSVILGGTISETSASIQEQHILYGAGAPLYLIALFFIATLSPFFFSSLPKAPILGIFLGIAALIVAWTDHTFFISLWCYVGALLSIGLLFVLKDYKK